MSLKRFINQKSPFIQMEDCDTVDQAIDKMIVQKKGAVVILHEDTGLRGVFTERDVMTKVVAGRLDPATTQLKDVMTTDVVLLPASSTLDHALNVMGKNGIRHLPVQDKKNNIIGMISLRHLLHEKVEMVVEELNAVESYDNDALGG